MGSVTQKSPVPDWRAELMEHAVVGVIQSAEVSYSLFSKSLCICMGWGTEEKYTCVTTPPLSTCPLSAITNILCSKNPGVQTAGNTEVQQDEPLQVTQAAQHHQSPDVRQHQSPTQLSQQSFPLLQSSSHGIQPTSITQPGPGTWPSHLVYAVTVEVQPRVEHGGSEFIFSMQHNQYNSQSDYPYAIIANCPKIFVSASDAKRYALELFTERLSVDYRYVVQRDWHDLSNEEIRAHGLSECGPSPLLSKARTSVTHEGRGVQVIFGCDEESCRIAVIPVLRENPRIVGYNLVGAGQPHSEIEHPICP